MERRDRDIDEPATRGFFERAMQRLRGRVYAQHDRGGEGQGPYETPEQAAIRARLRAVAEAEQRKVESPMTGRPIPSPWPERGTGWGGASQGGWDEDSAGVDREPQTIGPRSGAHSPPAALRTRDEAGPSAHYHYERGLAPGEYGHPFGPREWERQWSGDRARWSEHDAVRGAWTDHYEAGEHRSDVQEHRSERVSDEPRRRL